MASTFDERMHYVITITVLVVSAISSVLFFRESKKRMNDLEKLLEKDNSGHSMVGGVKMHPALFYFGLLSYQPDWVSKDREAKAVVLRFRLFIVLFAVSSVAFVISLLFFIG